MTWSDFYLFCFLVGFSLSVLSFLAGAIHLHLPFKCIFRFMADMQVVISVAAQTGAWRGVLTRRMHISWFNASTVLAFLAWFGGTGYLLTKHSHVVSLLSLFWRRLRVSPQGGLFFASC